MSGSLFDDRNNQPKKGGPSSGLNAFGLSPRPGNIIPLTDLRNELGASSNESLSELRERFYELLRRADCRYANDTDWSRLRRSLIVPKEGELFEPALEAKLTDDRERLKRMRVLCESLIPLDQEIQAKIAFMQTCLKRGASLLEGEEAPRAQCLTQLAAFKAGRPAYLTGDELSLLNDFWKFKEEFEAFSPAAARRQPSEKLGNSGFVWQKFPDVWGRPDMVWLPILEGSRYPNTPIFDKRDRRRYIESLLRAERSPRNPARRREREEILRLALQYYEGALSAERAAEFLKDLYRRYPPPLPF